MLENTIRKQTQTTLIRHEPSFKTVGTFNSENVCVLFFNMCCSLSTIYAYCRKIYNVFDKDVYQFNRIYYTNLSHDSFLSCPRTEEKASK